MNIFKSIFGGTDANVLNAKDAEERIKSDNSLYILDVREPDEFRAGHIDGATLIPLGELSKKMSKLPKDRDILCVCQTGSRSSVAVNQLRQAGYQAINLRGGMMGWQWAGFAVKRGK